MNMIYNITMIFYGHPARSKQASFLFDFPFTITPNVILIIQDRCQS